MAKNTELSKAKNAKKDEFYTQYEDIQNELNHYETHFREKTVFCNCDDPFESNFCKFFLRNFNYLGLRRLICTSYSTSPVIGQQLSLFDCQEEPVMQGNGYVMDITEVPMSNGRGVSDEDINALLKSKKRGVKKLKGNGDFRSEECITYLKQADIVVTNPPFSLFREYIAQLMKYKRDFLVIGNINAITYKEIFPLIKNNKLWLGASIHSGDRKFYVPDDYPLRAAGCGIDQNGRKYIRVKGVRWFTNLDYNKRHEELILYKKYTPEEYPKYDNYNAINVDKTADIPCDYFENMGVPITYLDKHNPEQFEIVDANDIRANEKVPVKGHGLIKDKEAILRERERERERDGADYLCPHRHQTQNVTASSAYPLHSLTSTTRSSLKSSALTDTSRITPNTGTGSLSADGKFLPESLSREKCNGIMGVPITFLDKYNPEQFEIIGLLQSSNEELAGIPILRTYNEFKEMRQDMTFTGSSGGKANGNPVLAGKSSKGNFLYNPVTKEFVHSAYARILIRRKRP